MTSPMARRSAGTLAMRMLGLAGGFVFAVVAARTLGPSGYGVVAVALSTATVIATISLLGANGLAVREIAAHSARGTWSALRQFIRQASLAVMTTSLCAGVLMAAASLVPGPYAQALLLGSLAVPLLAGVNLLRGFNQGTGNVVAAQIPMDIVRWAIVLVVLAFLILRRGSVGPTVVILAMLFGLVASLIAASLILIRYLDKLPGERIYPASTPWLRQSLPFLAIAGFGIVGTEINTLLLGWLAGPHEAGLYQPIAKLAPLMLLANEAIEASIGPRIVHLLEERNRTALQRMLGRSAVASTLATAGIVVALIIASPLILGTFGAEFKTYQGLLVWIGCAQVINAATGAAPLLMSMRGEMRRKILAQAATLVIQAGLGISLVPTFGALGAVVSLVVAIVAWAILHWWIAWRTTGIDTSIAAAFRA